MDMHDTEGNPIAAAPGHGRHRRSLTGWSATVVSERPNGMT